MRRRKEGNGGFFFKSKNNVAVITIGVVLQDVSQPSRSLLVLTEAFAI